MAPWWKSMAIPAPSPSFRQRCWRRKAAFAEPFSRPLAVFLAGVVAAHFSSICSLFLALPGTRDHHPLRQQDAEQSRR
jgi:hypothetical protein